jgi:methylenetetrahydrofolate reductase (NADPH)
MQVTNAKQMPDVKQVGIEWAIQQSLNLKAAPCFTLYYSRENQENIRQISFKGICETNGLIF